MGDRAFVVDAATIAAVSVAICLASQDLSLMSWIVPVILVARLVLSLSLPLPERGTTRLGEIFLFVACTLLGAFNDWMSVARHQVYQYTVPTDLPGLSPIPIWMLLYWGMILRFVLTVVAWRRLGLPVPAPDLLGKPRPLGRLVLLLLLVILTRQSIYRLYLHPIWSWLPFALALVLLIVFCRPHRRWLALMGAVVVVGPAIESLYIRLGRLHAYHLGWIGGVPLWIALWWGLGVLVWGEIGSRYAFSRSAQRSSSTGS